MTSTFEILQATRENFLKIIDFYPLDALNEIAPPFRNNIFWNVAHSLVTQQVLVYQFSGLSINLDDDFVARYRKGTLPENPATEKDLKYLKEQLISTVDRLKDDYNSGVFKTYEPYATSYGYTIVSAESAIEFNNSHEAMHLGDVLMMRKFLTKV